MTTRDPQATAAGQTHHAENSGHVDPGEREQLVYALNVRFAPHLQAAAAAVRDAEQDLARASEELSRSRQAAANQPYQSDRLVFMRAAVKEEVEALTRKTTTKKVRVAYRYLVARAVELAEGEVQGYQSDQAAAQREREHSVDACLEAQLQANERLHGARAMQERVHDAEQAARHGLAVMVEKRPSQSENEASA